MSIDRWHTLTVLPWLETVLKNRTRYLSMAAFFLDALRYPLWLHAQASPLGNHSAEFDRLSHEPSNALATDGKLACLPSVPRTAMVNAEKIGHAAPPKEEAVELSEGSDTLARASRGNYNAVKRAWL
jgi:hypothetical protein